MNCTHVDGYGSLFIDGFCMVCGIAEDHNHTENDDRVFVFGSNQFGYHGGGAAWYAHNKLGAEWGVGEGLTGRTYALPTCVEPGLPVDLGSLEEAVDRFIEFASLNPEMRFFVSEVGCGLAGFDAGEVAPLFSDAPSNCDLPPRWTVQHKWRKTV